MRSHARHQTDALGPVAAAMLWLAWGCTSAVGNSEDEHRVVRTPDEHEVVAADVVAARVATPTEYYSDEELRAAGYEVVRLNPDEAVVCGRDLDWFGNPKCFCIAPLACGDDCVAFDDNIRAFRAALANRDASPSCTHAEIGSCGDMRFFEFVGAVDAEVHERRFFGGDGRMAAMATSTDYTAFCSGRTREAWFGGVPKCGPFVSEEQICGAPSGVASAPTEWVEKNRAAKDE